MARTASYVVVRWTDRDCGPRRINAGDRLTMSQTRTIPLAVAMRDGWQGGAALGDPCHWPLESYQHEIAYQYQRAATIDPRIIPSYERFMDECAAQFAAMVAAGVKVEFCDEDPTPIDPETGRISHRLFVEQVRESAVLRVYRSGDDDHPILCRRWFVHEGRLENLNSIFRAVHDWFGHLASGGHFGWRGETTAYYSHARMFSAEARIALFSETVAQQCMYAVTRDYCEQKCVYFGEGWHNPPLA